MTNQSPFSTFKRNIILINIVTNAIEQYMDISFGEEKNLEIYRLCRRHYVYSG